MTTLVSPYKDINQYTRIKVQPHQLNSDIRNNMKLILKKKVEKKCNKNGFIEEVYRIIDFDDGQLYPENLSGCIMFNVKYHCRICLPIENSTIIAKIIIINHELMIATNGPIFIFIPKENIDSNVWKIIDNSFINKKEKKLAINDFVKVKILNKRINMDDWQIKAIGLLNDFATKDEVKKYYNQNDDDDDINEELNEKSDDEDNYII
jgi:DNA-directed RNA polymerase subunit E'/Rpb7